MARESKYIIYDDGLTECALLFNNHLNHAQIATNMGVNPISAGFVTFEINDLYAKIEPNVFGESVSLKLQSRPKDAEIIKRVLRLFN
jgi:hypothetical protein